LPFHAEGSPASHDGRNRKHRPALRGSGDGRFLVLLAPALPGGGKRLPAFVYSGAICGYQNRIGRYDGLPLPAKSDGTARTQRRARESAAKKIQQLSDGRGPDGLRERHDAPEFK
jgi:hypothetical protein